MGDKGKGDKIKFDPSKDYKKGFELYKKFLPLQLAEELKYRGEYDPKFIEQALGLQHTYDPQLAREQVSAVQRRDPEWVRAHKLFGDKVSDVLERGYVDPTRAKLYEATGKRATGDILRGETMSPEMKNQTIQAILARSPNLSYGEAQDMAAAVYTGQRGQQLLQQRQQAANQFLGQQSESDLALTAGGRYMSTPTMTSMINQTPGVTPPSAMRYFDPNAGRLGQAAALAYAPLQMAQQQMGGGGSTNPWMSALQGASTGASYGSAGGGYGAAGGAITGGILGAFGYPQYSDARLKTNISRTQLSTPDGIPIVKYTYRGKRWVGVLAQDVEKVRPDAVYNFGNGRLGVFYSRIGVELRELPLEGVIDALRAPPERFCERLGVGTAENKQNDQEDV